MQKKLKLPTMQKNKQQYGGSFTFFLQTKGGAKSVELSFYFYFARNLFSCEIFLSKNEPWNQRFKVSGKVYRCSSECFGLSCLPGSNPLLFHIETKINQVKLEAKCGGILSLLFKFLIRIVKGKRG